MSAPEPGIREALRDRLEAVVGARFVTDRPERLEVYARDAWPRIFLAAREAKVPRPPDLVVWPKDRDEVAAVVGICREARVPVIPYGAGSGVCGGTYALEGGVAIDLKRIDHVGAVDPVDRLVHVGAGAIGQHLEDRLAAQGYTLGHFPSSIYCSTAGGWLAARSAGQCSARYGKIEDLVSGLAFVDGTGRLRVLGPRPRAGDGPDLAQTVIGSEGTLGVITDAVLRVRRAPAHRRMRGVLMPSLDSGLEAIRKIFAAGHRPAVVRLYDPLDTLVNKGKGTDTGKSGMSTWLRRAAAAVGAGRSLGVERARHAAVRTVLTRPRTFGNLFDRLAGPSMMVLGSEGQDERLVDHEAKAVLDLCLAHGGRDLGPGPGERWLLHRHAVSYKITPALSLGLVVDTMETATTWDRLLGLYHGVRDAVREHAFVMAHFSHAYEDGASIYFTFSGWGGDLAAREQNYDRTWKTALEAVVAHGGTISHHHGVGMSKQAFMVREHGEGGMAMLRALKRTLDPDGIMNPGKLGLGGGPELPGAPFEVAAPRRRGGGFEEAA
jgi:alkyldihydroxyacetonephosphate synthase